MNHPPTNQLRLFVALELPESAKIQLAQLITQLKTACGTEKIPTRVIKWVNPQTIHLTTQFLGDTPPNQVKEIQTTITEALNQLESQSGKSAFALQSNSLGAFPNLTCPKAIWTDLIGSDLTRLKDTVQTITSALIKINCPLNPKPFKPHLTLGRLRRDSNPPSLQSLAATIKFKPIELTLQKLTLYQSELTPSGPIHTPLQTWEFPASEIFN